MRDVLGAALEALGMKLQNRPLTLSLSQQIDLVCCLDRLADFMQQLARAQLSGLRNGIRQSEQLCEM